MQPTNGSADVADGRAGRVTRRRLLGAAGATAVAGLAGCTADAGRPDCPLEGTASLPEDGTHPADDVTMWRRGLRRWGYYPDEVVPDDVRVNWEFPINYVGHSAAKASPVPTPDGETIVFAGDTGRVEAYTPGGEKRWSTRTGATSLGFHGSAAIVDGVVYIGGYDGDLYALEVDTGDQVWRTRSEELDGTLAIGSSPAYYDGTLYVVAEYGTPSSGALWAIDPETGEPTWHDDRIWGQPHPSATIDLETGRILTGSNDGAVYCWEYPCLDFAWKFQAGPDGNPDGEPKAGGEFSLGAEIKGTAPVFDGRAYVGSWDGHFYCLDLEGGEEVWSFETGRVIMSNPAVHPGAGVVYVGSDDRYVYALDAESGDELWSTYVDGRVIGSITVTDGTVLVGSHDSHLYALDRETGDRRWRVPNRGRVTSAAVPLDGRIYYAERAVVEGYRDDDRDERLVEPGHAYCLVGDG